MANMTSAVEPLRRGCSASGILAVQIDPDTGYFINIDEIRDREYPSLQDTTYLDHAGATTYPKSLIDTYSKDLASSLLGNPHSTSASSQLSSRRIDDTRLQVLRFFNARPEDFDVVFVANATAGIKLVADAFRDHESGFWYGYHADSHTSLIGVRELATKGTRCFHENDDVETWISELGRSTSNNLRLFAYPGQSNMTGHRTPLSWCEKLRKSSHSLSRRTYTLYDAAGLLSTSPLDLGNASAAPDFTVCSFYKIFGFPDLGALIIRKESGDILRARKYFGGGTVDMVMTLGEENWHAKKNTSLHARLEDGTLPFHTIIALQSALRIHNQMYGSQKNVSRHCQALISHLCRLLTTLRHANGLPVVKVYGPTSGIAECQNQGPLIAFNLLDQRGAYIPKSEVEKLATVKNIQLRTGGLCNPGGIAKYLDLSPEEMRRNFASGQRCGDEHDLFDGKPTGAIRVSLGAMSNFADVQRFMDFLDEFYIDRTAFTIPTPASLSFLAPPSSLPTIGRPPERSHFWQPSFTIESLSVFPIKSCAAFQIPPDTRWDVGTNGLSWDREWCIVHQGTGMALSQKRYPRMALLKPTIDLKQRLLRICFDLGTDSKQELVIALDVPHSFSAVGMKQDGFRSTRANVCGSCVDVQTYTAPGVSAFFTDALSVPCNLARFSKKSPALFSKPNIPGALPAQIVPARSITLANDSPVLLISRSSVNRLNEEIKLNGHRKGSSGGIRKAVSADAFRGNIVIAEELCGGQAENPYIEDEWKSLRIIDRAESDSSAETTSEFEVLGPCQRCQMVCVDQKSAKRTQEPFSTLAKNEETRRTGMVRGAPLLG